MTTNVVVTAPGYPGKKVIVLVSDGRGSQWRKAAVLSQGESHTTAATGSQDVCVVEMTDEDYAESQWAVED